LAQLISGDTRQELGPEIEEDMNKFLVEMENEAVDLKALGIKGVDKQTIINILYQCDGLKANL